MKKLIEPKIYWEGSGGGRRVMFTEARASTAHAGYRPSLVTRKGWVKNVAWVRVFVREVALWGNIGK